jgi:hypothetical protein
MVILTCTYPGCTHTWSHKAKKFQSSDGAAHYARHHPNVPASLTELKKKQAVGIPAAIAARSS